MKLHFQDKHPSPPLVDVQYKVDDFEKIRQKKVLMAAVFYCITQHHLNIWNNICLLALDSSCEAHSRALDTGRFRQQISWTAERDLKAPGC